MSNKKQPWVKFYTVDWRSDPRLKMCSMAARGLWIEMICLMHEATPYGHLLVSGQCPTDAQLAVLVGAPPEQITALLGELESAGVFSRTREGVIYSRKLSRMAKKAATARNNGRKGGNPTLCNNGDIPPSDNPPDKGRDKTQRLEARDQSKKEEPIGSSKKNPAKSQRKPEVELPDGWVPNDANVQHALKKGLTPQEIDHEADQFRNYHHSKQSRFRDWNAAWRTWVGNSIKFGRSGRVVGGAKPGNGGQRSSLASIAARRHAQGF